VEICVLWKKSTSEENERSEAKTPEARSSEVNCGRRSEKDMCHQIVESEVCTQRKRKEEVESLTRSRLKLQR
jgi:hypothetical protein